MRILILSNLYPPHGLGGYDLRCHDVVNGLLRRGHSVTVITSTYGVGKRLRNGHVERVLHSRWDLLHRPLTRRQMLLTEVRNNIRLRQTIARVRPHIISIWNMLLVSRSLVATAQRSGLPVTLHIDDDWMLRHDPWLSLWSNSGRRPWTRAIKTVVRPPVDLLAPTVLLPDSRFHWVFISNYRKQQHLRAGLPVADAQVIHGGIPSDLFQARRFEEFSSTAAPRRLLFVGVLTHAKGPHLAIEALAYLTRNGFTDVTLTIVGPTIRQDYMHGLRESVLKQGLASQVRFLGAVDRAELAAIYRQHDILLFTSTAPEGFPLTILEAMASGLPVVSSVTGGHGEILEDGENAFTYPCGDSVAMAERIKCLMNQPDIARRLAEAGHKIVRREFTLDIMLDRYERILEQVTESAA